MKLCITTIRSLMVFVLVCATQSLYAHDTDFHDTRIINPLKIPITIRVGTIRRTIGGDMVEYPVTIASQSSVTVPIRQPNLSRMESTMQSPWAVISKTLPEGNFVRSFEITYGTGPGAKRVIAGTGQIAALNQCVDLLERQGRRSKESGLQILDPTLSRINIPFACMIDDSPVLESGIDDQAIEDQDLLSYSADNPAPYEGSLPVTAADPGPTIIPDGSTGNRHQYQQDSQYNYPVGWKYYPEYEPQVRPDHPNRMDWKQEWLPGGHRMFTPQPILNPAAIHQSAY